MHWAALAGTDSVKGASDAAAASVVYDGEIIHFCTVAPGLVLKRLRKRSVLVEYTFWDSVEAFVKERGGEGRLEISIGRGKRSHRPCWDMRVRAVRFSQRVLLFLAWGGCGQVDMQQTCSSKSPCIKLRRLECVLRHGTREQKRQSCIRNCSHLSIGALDHTQNNAAFFFCGPFDQSTACLRSHLPASRPRLISRYKANVQHWVALRAASWTRLYPARGESAHILPAGPTCRPLRR
jgi:hypothetical protein